MRKNKLVYQIVLVLFLIAQFQFLTLLNLPPLMIPGTRLQFDARSLSLLNPPNTDSAGLSSASATLSNPRLSFQGRVSAQVNAGANVVTLNTSPNLYGDINTNNLFPNDTVAVGINGNIPVASISSATVFTLKNPLTVTVPNTAYIYATQSGTLTFDFYTAAAVPNGGSLRFEIPAATGSISGSANDGAPDTNTTTAGNGFDLNGMTNSNVSCPPGPFTPGTLTAGSGSNPHVITCNATAAVPAGAHFVVTVGSGVPLVNPAPINTGHTQGLADIYTMSIFTMDNTNGTGNQIESVNVKTAPVEGVLVSATVDETLSFQVAGVAIGSSTYCGVSHTAGLTTTATAVPWGTINSSYNVDRNNAVQQLTVTTNAPTGYTVYGEENDQMGKDGNACTGATPSVEPYTYTGGGICIRDYNKSGATWQTYFDWTNTPGTDYGLGYSLDNAAGGGTDATFLYNTAGGVFDAKHFADQEAGQNKYASTAQLMSNTGPVSGSSVNVCYRIHIPAGQPAGYYYNKLKYTAVAKF